MQITNFTISNDRTEINITITDALDLVALRFWTDSTYKDYDEFIDLSSFLVGSATETLTILLSDLGLSYFNGVYFLEAEDDNSTSNAITSDLTRYEECILNKLIQYGICEDCMKKEDISLTNAQGLLNGLKIALSNGFINEIIILLRALNKYCSNTCKTCRDYKNIIDVTYYSSND